MSFNIQTHAGGAYNYDILACAKKACIKKHSLLHFKHDNYIVLLNYCVFPNKAQGVIRSPSMFILESALTFIYTVKEERHSLYS